LHRSKASRASRTLARSTRGELKPQADGERLNDALRVGY
jgi:hypothetical protein